VEVETARLPIAKPKPLTPRATLQSNVKRKGAAAEFRADFILWLQQHEICEQMPSKQPAALARRPPGHKLLLCKYVIVNGGRWGRGMLGAQRASLGSDELHAGAPLQPPLGATPQNGLC
jgi:hypothetical protein